MYEFSHYPTAAEIKEISQRHKAEVEDYVRIWFEDGTTKTYSNIVPKIFYYNENLWIIKFFSKELYAPGSFGRLRIIRSKRIIKRKD